MRPADFPLLLNAVRDLVDGLKAGGVTIETEMPGQGEAPLPGRPRRLLIRTVVQLDGDMLVFIDPAIDVDSPEWVAHTRQIRRRIGTMASGIDNLVDLCASGVSIVWMLYWLVGLVRFTSWTDALWNGIWILFGPAVYEAIIRYGAPPIAKLILARKRARWAPKGDRPSTHRVPENSA